MKKMLSASPSPRGIEPLTEKNVTGYMESIVMWKVTDNQLILRFGSAINQPAEPHGEHERGKLAPCGQVTHTPEHWHLFTSCATIRER